MDTGATTGTDTGIPTSEARDPRPHLGAAFASGLGSLAVPWQATACARPELLVLNEPLAHELGLDTAWLRGDAGAQFLVGGEVAPGSRPVAQAYAGHQFGVYVPRLGDGRALLLGELRTRSGELHDLHLKGSGRTPFSRGGDGFAAVGPMLREYLMGEAMHTLGVPTTRGLAVVGTGGRVLREDSLDPLPGAVLTRVAASHLRVGTFQYARQLEDLGVLRDLVAFAADRHLAGGVGAADAGAGAAARPALRLLKHVIAVQAQLVAQWMLVGFVHGVMNTDNTTVSGETIDYGPCAFIDAYDPAAVFSSIDHRGRYAYGNQPGIVLWNLTRFAESLLPLLAEEIEAIAGMEPGVEGHAAEREAAAEQARANAVSALEGFSAAYDRAWLSGMRRKLGLGAGMQRGGSGDGWERRAEPAGATDERVTALAAALLGELHQHHIDYTRAFRALGAAARGDTAPVHALYPSGAQPGEWLRSWLDLGPGAAAMDEVNPAVIPRNHLVDEALEAATAGDLGPFVRLLDAVTQPFAERDGFERYAQPAPAGSPRHVTYCGT